MRLIKTNLFFDQLKSWIRPLINKLFEAVPAGLGRRGFLKFKENDLKKIIEGGVFELSSWKNFLWEKDINHIENNGRIAGADFFAISKEAKERGINQLATLGSGNHYLEIQKVEKIIDQSSAEKLGIIAENQVMVMIHCGSRGLGHQVCSDYLRLFEKKMTGFNYRPKDRQLACLPIKTTEAKSYLSAMAGAANFAFVNRQLITYQIRKVFSQVLGKKAEELAMDLVYDVAHNIGKFENHQVPESQKKGRFFIHRKGATRSFPNQPVIIGGSMETGSYLLMGTNEALLKSYGSTAHGSGRTMSRARAKKEIRGEKLWQEMKQKGIYVKSASFAGLAEEAGVAYKNISDVVKSINLAGLSKPVA
jgi:tRNA-splicing ligase RtcB